MRNSLRIPLILGLLLVVCCLFGFLWAVPKLAAFSIPARWQRLPVKQQRSVAREYLGQPFRSDLLGDVWEEGHAASKTYKLAIYYGADSSCMGYSIRYRYHSAFFSKEYLLDSFSVR